MFVNTFLCKCATFFYFVVLPCCIFANKMLLYVIRKDVIAMNIGSRIKERRLELHLSLEQLGNKLGINKSTVYRYETGDIESMPIDILLPIAEALQTTPSALMGWDEPENDFSIEAAASLINEDDPLLQRLIGAYEAMDEKKRELLVDLAENMK